MIIFWLFVFGLYGAFVSRWHGGGFFSAPRGIKNTFWALPFGVVSYMALSIYIPWYWSILGGVIAFGLCFAGKSTGHGRVWNPYFPMNMADTPEKIEFFTRWILNKVSDFWYKNICMAIIGFVAVSGAVFAVGWHDIWFAVIIAMGGGLGKSIGYLIGWKQGIFEGNVAGELITGLCSFVTLGYVFLKILEGV